MKPEVLIVAAMMSRVMDTLATEFTAHRLWEAADQAALLASIGPRIRGIATTGGRGAEAKLIAALPALEIIACYGVGVDAIDLAAARTRGIVVTNTPDVLTDDVADLGVALLLAASRRICEGDRHVRSGAWLKGDMALTRKFTGSKVGILGLVGSARPLPGAAPPSIARSPGMGRTPSPTFPGASFPAWSIWRRRAIFSAELPGGAASSNLVDRRVLDALGPQLLVNVSRGSVARRGGPGSCACRGSARRRRARRLRGRAACPAGPVRHGQCGAAAACRECHDRDFAARWATW